MFVIAKMHWCSLGKAYCEQALTWGKAGAFSCGGLHWGPPTWSYPLFGRLGTDYSGHAFATLVPSCEVLAACLPLEAPTFTGMTPQLDGPEGHLFMSVPISELSQGATVLWMQT